MAEIVDTRKMNIDELLSVVAKSAPRTEGHSPLAVVIRYMIDGILSDCAGRDLFSTSELSDRLLDIRLILNEHIIPDNDDLLDKSEGDEEAK
jgi:hypothetical protein